LKLELEFATGDDLINFLSSLTSVGRKLCGVTEKAATAAAREVNTPSATVTPEKQEAARQSTKKSSPATTPTPAATPSAPTGEAVTPEAALASTLTYERDFAPVFAKAVVHNKPAALKALWPHPSAIEVPASNWPSVMTALQAVLDGPTLADTPPALDYEKDVVPKIKAASTKDKAKLAEILKAHGGVGEDGKISGRFLKPEALPAVVKALDELLGA
jgi:hypothetical protein